MSGLPRDKRTLVLRGLLSIVGLSSIGAVVAGFYGDFLFRPHSVGSDAFSKSALGHLGFLEWLERAGHSPFVVRSFANRRTATKNPLIVLEPSADDPAAELAIGSLASRREPMLVVAPKWRGEVDPKTPMWIASVERITDVAINRVMDRCGVTARIETADGVQRFTHPDLGEPIAIENAQWFATGEIEPIVGGEQKILFGRLRSRPSVFVLADPDVLANHGIDDPANRRLLSFMFERMEWGDQPIVVDETIHGATFERDIWREALRMPLLPLSLSVFATALFVVFAARRFLSPREELSVLGAGKRALIENTAGLYGDSMSADDLCRRYRTMVELDVAQHLRVPERMKPEERHALIQSRAAARGKPFDLDRWQQDVRERTRGRKGARLALLAIAELRTWKDEVMRGSTGD